jgi:hypothetical protein
MKLRALFPNSYIPVSVSDLFIYFQDQSAIWEQFRFWEYINRKQTFISDYHRPFICSVYLKQPKDGDNQRRTFY